MDHIQREYRGNTPMGISFWHCGGETPTITEFEGETQATRPNARCLITHTGKLSLGLRDP